MEYSIPSPPTTINGSPVKRRRHELRVNKSVAQFRQSFEEILRHIRAPRRNPHNPDQLREQDYLVIIKLARGVILGQALDDNGVCLEDKNAAVSVSKICDGTFRGDETICWAFHTLMQVIKLDGLPWKNEWALSVYENGSVGSVSLWAHNSRCPHELETCLINVNVEIFFCKETLTATVSYQAAWRCAGECELPETMVAKSEGHQHDQIASRKRPASEVFCNEEDYEASEYPEPPSFSPPLAPALSSDDYYPAVGAMRVSGTASAPGTYYPIAAAMRACIPAMENTTSQELSLVQNSRSSASEMKSAVFTLGNIDPALGAELFAATLPAMHLPFFSPDAAPPAPSDDPISLLTGFAPSSNSRSLHQQGESGSSSFNSSLLDSQIHFASYDGSDLSVSSTSAFMTDYTRYSIANPPGEPLTVTDFSPIYTTPLPFNHGHNTSSAIPFGFPSTMDFSRTSTPSYNSPVGFTTSSNTPTVPTKRPRPRPRRRPTTTAPTGPLLSSDPTTPSVQIADIIASLHAAIPAPPRIPEPHRSQQFYFINSNGRVSRTRNADPRCLRCRRRHWSSCSRGRPCDECIKAGARCEYGVGLGEE